MKNVIQGGTIIVNGNFHLGDGDIYPKEKNEVDLVNKIQRLLSNAKIDQALDEFINWVQ